MWHILLCNTHIHTSKLMPYAMRAGNSEFPRAGPGDHGHPAHRPATQVGHVQPGGHQEGVRHRRHLGGDGAGQVGNVTEALDGQGGIVSQKQLMDRGVSCPRSI